MRATAAPLLLGLLVLLIAAGSSGVDAAAAAKKAQTHVRGVRPELADKYEPVDGEFACLDGSKRIAYAAVNDDFCDCPDGSDEPGAICSACRCHGARGGP